MGESASTESQPSKLCSWILFPLASQVKIKSDAKFSGRNRFKPGNLRRGALFHRIPSEGSNCLPRPEDFRLKPTKVAAYRWQSRSFEVQGDHGLGLFAMAGIARQGPQAAHQKSRKD